MGQLYTFDSPFPGSSGNFGESPSQKNRKASDRAVGFPLASYISGRRKSPSCVSSTSKSISPWHFYRDLIQNPSPPAPHFLQRNSITAFLWSPGTKAWHFAACNWDHRYLLSQRRTPGLKTSQPCCCRTVSAAPCEMAKKTATGTSCVLWV